MTLIREEQKSLGAPLAGAIAEGRHEACPYHPLRQGSISIGFYKIAIVVTHPIQYFVPLFRRLAQEPGVDCTVLYSSLMGSQAYIDSGFSLKVKWDIPLLEGYRYKVMPGYFLANLRNFFSCTSPQVVAELSKGGYDAVIVFGWGQLTSWLAFLGAGLGRVPVMMYGDTNVLHESSKSRFLQAIRRTLLTRLFRRVAAFLVSGTFNRKFYESFGVPPEKCFRVPLAVDNDYFTAGAESAKKRRDEFRGRLGIAPEAVVLLFVGKLVPWKRPQDLLYAAVSLRERVPHLAIAFAGEGELRPFLESEIRRLSLKNVHLLGFKNQSELPEIYGISDIFVLPSSRDPRGLVTNEAMACSLPIIVSDRTGVWGDWDLVRDGENGFVYPCGDVGALGQAIYRLVTEPGLRERMAARSHEIISGFGYDQCVEGILKALDHETGGLAA
jgi:glycosyltransferase involved in cell wall biosynthesis